MDASRFHAILETVAVPIVVVDHELRLIAANRQALTLLEQQTSLRTVDGKVAGITAEQTGTLAAAVGAHDPRRPILVHRPATGIYDVIAAAPCPALGAGLVALTLFAVLASADDTEHALRCALRLTRREARLAVELFNGRSVPEAARAAEMELTTARTHLRNIAEKTGLRRQAEIVRIVTSLAHAIAGSPAGAPSNGSSQI